MLELDGALSLWVVGLLGVLLGIGLGSVLTYALTARKSQNQDLQAELDRLAGQFTAYREQVGSHFMQTSDLVQEMTRSYRAVYEHLATGAYQLYGAHADNQSLEHQGSESATGAVADHPADPNYDELAELSSLKDDIDTLINESARFRTVDVANDEDEQKPVKH